MTITTVREKLHQQIDSLPDEIVQQIADFTLFMMARRRLSSSGSYADWNSDQWQDFVLENLFAEEDAVEYTLEDAQEIYRS